MRPSKRFIAMGGILSGCSLGCFLLLSSSAYAQSNIVHQLGVLSSGDEQFSTGSYFDSYKIEGSAGQRVSISLDSSDFDTFVGLFDDDGNPVATNDDASDTNLNSYLSATLPHNGTYTVIATSYESQGSGDYRMSLRNFSPPTPARTASSTSSSGDFSALVAHPITQLFMWGLVDSMFSSGGGTTSTANDDYYYYEQRPTPSQPVRRAPTPAIDPFYE